jgi:hypothetical protein
MPILPGGLKIEHRPCGCRRREEVPSRQLPDSSAVKAGCVVLTPEASKPIRGAKLPRLNDDMGNQPRQGLQPPESSPPSGVRIPNRHAA